MTIFRCLLLLVGATLGCGVALAEGVPLEDNGKRWKVAEGLGQVLLEGQFSGWVGLQDGDLLSYVQEGCTIRPQDLDQRGLVVAGLQVWDSHHRYRLRLCCSHPLHLRSIKSHAQHCRLQRLRRR